MNDKLTRIFSQTAILIFLLFSSLPASAQDQPFSPATEDSVMLTRLLENYELKFQAQLDQLPSQYKKDMAERYQQRWKNIQSTFVSREIYTDAGAQNYLNQLTSIIRRSNPGLSSDFTCYFSRSAIPNAAYIGQGIILFNMGLFEKLNDESQAVFVLCHEISHFLLRHSENSIQKYVATINSEEVQKSLHKIKKSEYGKHEQLQSLVKDLSFDNRRHSRDHESQADSMAMVLMKNTPFCLSSAISTMTLLDHIDQDESDIEMESYLPVVFNTPEYPFRKKWLAFDNGLLGGHAQISKDKMEDSLKTHPDCENRKHLMEKQIQAWSQPPCSIFVLDSSLFVSLKSRFPYETIEYAYTLENYSESLFLTLELLQKKPKDMFLVSHTGKLFNGMYAAQKAHTLSKVCRLPAPQYAPDYNLLLQFLQNLYLEDLASINYYFLKSYQTQMNSYSPYRNVYLQSEKLIKN